MHFARSQGILCQGRGSAANSLAAYLLDISPIDPLAHDLLFERFLSSERQLPPDIDIDFDAMRREMELPSNEPILESLAKLDAAHAARCHEILHRHELAGAERAVLLPGARELVAALHARGIRQAVATRNSRRITETTLLKLDLPFDLVLTRDDGPVKPDPWPVQEAARRWTISTAEIVVVGQPPERGAGQQEVAGASGAQVLELADGRGAIGRMMARVDAPLGLREMPAVAAVEAQQFVVPPADDEDA